MGFHPGDQIEGRGQPIPSSTSFPLMSDLRNLLRNQASDTGSLRVQDHLHVKIGGAVGRAKGDPFLGIHGLKLDQRRRSGFDFSRFARSFFVLLESFDRLFFQRLVVVEIKWRLFASIKGTNRKSKKSTTNCFDAWIPKDIRKKAISPACRRRKRGNHPGPEWPGSFSRSSQTS